MSDETRVNDHDRKLVVATAEVMQWSTEGDDPKAKNQLQLLGHNPDVIGALGDKAIGDMLAQIAETLGTDSGLDQYDEEQLRNIKALMVTAWEVGMVASELAYGGDNIGP